MRLLWLDFAECSWHNPPVNRVIVTTATKSVERIEKDLIAPAQRQIPPQDATIAVVTRQERQLDSLERVAPPQRGPAKWTPPPEKSITSGRNTREVNL